MNEQSIYQDDYRREFLLSDVFFQFLHERERNAQWMRQQTKDLEVQALVDGDPMTQLMQANYKLAEKEGVFEDTLKHTRLLLRVEKQFLPIRHCAVKTILARACIGGTALSKVEKPVMAKILNACLRCAKGEALLRVADEKVSAVLGGDGSDYAILSTPKLFEMTQDYLNREFPGNTFAGSCFEHSFVTALWELSGDSSMIESYRRTIQAHGLTPEDMRPALRFTTSDTGDSGANLYPMLFHGRADRMITLGNPLKVSHKNGNTLADFEKTLHMIFSQYELALGKLADLLNIEIEYPVNTMLGVMKKISIPKGLAYRAAELFKAQVGEDPCTAHELYYGISEVLFMAQCDGVAGTRLALLEENVARALKARWHDFDMPGDFHW